MDLLKYLLAYELGLFIIGIIIFISIIIIAVNSIIIAKRLKKIYYKQIEIDSKHINENEQTEFYEEPQENYQSLWASRKQ